MDAFSFERRQDLMFRNLDLTVYECPVPAFSRSFTLLHQGDMRQILCLMGLAGILDAITQGPGYLDGLGHNMATNMGVIAKRMEGVPHQEPDDLQYIRTVNSRPMMILKGARMPEVSSYREAFLQVNDLRKYNQVDVAKGAFLLQQIRQNDLPMERNIGTKVAMIAGTFDLF